MPEVIFHAMGVFKTKTEIGPDTVIQRKPDLLFNEIDGEVVMLSVENGEYYGMDQIGSRIWELLERPMEFKILVDTLLKEYLVSEKQCKEDTLKFLYLLDEKQLLLPL